MRPLIAVTARTTAEGRPWRTPGFGSPGNYLDSLRRAGALGALLQPAGADEHELVEALTRFDGVLLTGGPDVDPFLYGQDRHETVYGDDRAVDCFEIAICRTALATSTPVLAICRGLQVLNVALGGSLHQHIGDRPNGCDHGQPGVASSRTEVTLRAGSRLADIVGGNHICGNCRHHPAVDRVGDGLVPTAWAADGVIEALEPVEPAATWLLAVQWHPETVADREPQQQAIFDAFAVACRTRSRAPEQART